MWHVNVAQKSRALEGPPGAQTVALPAVINTGLELNDRTQEGGAQVWCPLPTALLEPLFGLGGSLQHPARTSADT